MDITLDHSDADVEIVFGSTLNNDPYEASWGISDFKCQIKWLFDIIVYFYIVMIMIRYIDNIWLKWKWIAIEV